jgi:hypothetical protein
VEVGAGLSLCGLVAAGEIGAPRVTVTDREPYALHCAMATAACHPNLLRIGGGGGERGGDRGGGGDDEYDHRGSSNGGFRNTKPLPILSAAVLDWCNVERSAPQLIDSATIVLASDVLYDHKTIDAFADACWKILHKKKSSSTTTSSNNSDSTTIATPTMIHEDCTVLVADPKVERCAGAREMLLRSRLATEAKTVVVVDLPTPSSSSSPSSSEKAAALTLDGRDHERRMQEQSVLIRFTF